MTTYAAQSPSASGVVLTFHAAASGDKISGIKNAGRLIVKNGSGGAITVTITPPGTTEYGVTNPVKTVSVADGAEEMITLLRAYRNSADSFNIALSWSGTSSVTWAATL